MKWILAGLLALHGLIHLLGFARAFEVGEASRLTGEISQGMGLLWLLAALALLVTAALVAAGHRWWWVLGIGAGILSQAVIVTSWDDARFGTIANILLLAGVLYGYASRGPRSFEAE